MYSISGSVTYIYTHSFQLLFHDRLLQDIGYSALCSIVGPCYSSILYAVVGMKVSYCEHLDWSVGPVKLSTVSFSPVFTALTIRAGTRYEFVDRMNE